MHQILPWVLWKWRSVDKIVFFTGKKSKVIGGTMAEVLVGKQVIVDTNGDKWWFDTKTAKGFAKAVIKGAEITIYKTVPGNFVLHSLSKTLSAGYDERWLLYSEQEIVAWALEYELADVLIELGSAINAYER